MFDLRLGYVHQEGRSKGEGDKAGPDGSRVLHEKEKHLYIGYVLTRPASMVQIPENKSTRLFKRKRATDRLRTGVEMLVTDDPGAAGEGRRSDVEPLKH
jgi:hypothetical protein